MAKSRFFSREPDAKSEPLMIESPVMPENVYSPAEASEEPYVAYVWPKKGPIFSAEGVLLNPQDCEIGADGVVRGK